LVVIEDMLANTEVAGPVIKALPRVPETNVVVIYERAADKRTKAFKDLASRPLPVT
jgi:hypothetical protein